MHLGQGGPDHPSSKRGGQKEAGGDEDGGADEGGEESAVDGLSLWPWLGEKRQMPWSVKKKSKKYIPRRKLEEENFLFIAKRSNDIFAECL